MGTKRALMARNITTCLGLLLSLSLVGSSVTAQMYYPGGYPYSYGPEQEDPADQVQITEAPVSRI
jgi:hypothetical protein